MNIRHPKFKKLLVYKILRHIKNYFGHLFWVHCYLVTDLLAIIREHRLEKKFNVETYEPCDLKEKSGLYKDGQVYVPTPFLLLQRIMDYVKPGGEDIFLDFGCGKGRVVFFASMWKLKKVIGVELNQERFEAAQRNLAHFKLNKTPIELVNADAVHYRVKDETIFFLFDPFGRETLRKVIQSIGDSLRENARPVRIIYYHPVYQEILDDQGWLMLEKDMKKENCMIWRSRS